MDGKHITDTNGDWARQVLIPDIFPAAQLPAMNLLSMAAGDMVEVYGGPKQAGAFDFVLTCFFIDTSHNIIEYIEVIHNALKARAPSSALPA
jgi:carnosine N-methyltransferase